MGGGGAAAAEGQEGEGGRGGGFVLAHAVGSGLGSWLDGWAGGREFCPYYSQQQAGPPPQLSNRELALEGQVVGV
jgi:hypothetical protein